ncbi:MAG: phosphatidylinositol mannoside acyltransferase, partial [Longispora sp.]|nr:phosphatidylinositol mannoside acyltransferase [Longispora sp. (in: high G+C Gram-positive bacteria)]
VRAIPGPIAGMAFRAGADFAAHGKGDAARRLAANLRRVVGPEMPDEEFNALVRAGLRSYARYWLETFRLPTRTHAQLLTDFRMDRGELLLAHAAAGEGAIIALPHGGNWDAAGAWGAASGIPITTVAERLRPEGLYRKFLAFREGLGMHIIPSSGGDQPPADLLAERIEAGHLVPLLADKDLSRRGVEVKFFGGRTRMPGGPAMLSIRTGAPLYVVSMWYEPDVARGRLIGPLKVPTRGSLGARISELTQLVADTMAQGIAEHPEDWHMLQRLWLDD